MGLAVLRSRALAGVEAPEVTVEVHLADGLPTFTIVGLADTEVREARDRVRAALQNSGYDFPAGRLTVNLAPADLPKESARFDLPIALGILVASGQLPDTGLDDHEFAGELSLTGRLRPVRAALAMAHAMHAQSRTARAFVLPRDSAAEAALVPGLRILAADSLQQVVAHFCSSAESGGVLPQARPAIAPEPVRYPDLADVKGQSQARRALEIAAAGSHSLLMVGPPGSGKSMLASRLPGILPPMTAEEAMEAAAIASLAGHFDASHWQQRPYRAPHHTASGVALVGGSQVPRPGEISLAHHGVLFLDELPEFERKVLEVLREPMESGRITISRAARQTDFPCRFQLVAAMNPCPCGYLGHATRRCRCTPDVIARYQGRISGPLLDRIDLQLTLAAVPAGMILSAQAAEDSATVAQRVLQARRQQQARQGKPNAQLDEAGVARYCRPEPAAEELLHQAIQRLGWTARAVHRLLKVARTIADAAAEPGITRAHMAEAIQYRRALIDSRQA